MSTFATILQNLLTEKNMKQSELSRLTKINKSSISEYLSGNYQPKYKNILKIAQVLNVSPTIFLEKSPDKEVTKLPILGKIAAGIPILAQENIEGYLPYDGNDADFCLRIHGDSMINARINDGDIVFIKQQATVENGEIAAVLINDSATLKRVYFLDNSSIQLRPENPKYKPMIFSKDNCDDFRILGKAIALYTRL